MILSKGGISYETAMDMTEADRAAWSIALGEAQGLDFDWDTLRFLEPDTR